MPIGRDHSIGSDGCEFFARIGDDFLEDWSSAFAPAINRLTRLNAQRSDHRRVFIAGGAAEERLGLAAEERPDSLRRCLRFHRSPHRHSCLGGTTWGTGYVPAKALIEGGHLTAWFGPAKFVASICTTLSGTFGGFFSPSLAVGAGIGNALAPFFPGSPTSAIALLGMAAFFVGVVRAPLTAVIILVETTASSKYDFAPLCDRAHCSYADQYTDYPRANLSRAVEGIYSRRGGIKRGCPRSSS